MSDVPIDLDAKSAQARALQRIRPEAVQPVAMPSGYAGLVTRAIALALDGLIVNGVAALVGVTVGLGVSVLHLPSAADAAIGAVLGALWIIWSFSYFVFFWSTTGQTPGSRLMSIRVIDVRGRGPLKPRRALLRFIGLCLAAIPLGAGYLIMLWDSRARCLQDRMARTVVVYVVPAPPV